MKLKLKGGGIKGVETRRGFSKKKKKKGAEGMIFFFFNWVTKTKPDHHPVDMCYGCFPPSSATSSPTVFVNVGGDQKKKQFPPASRSKPFSPFLPLLPDLPPPGPFPIPIPFPSISDVPYFLAFPEVSPSLSSPNPFGTSRRHGAVQYRGAVSKGVFWRI